MLTVTLPTSGGPVTVEATEPVPGLRVYEVPEGVSPTSKYRWILAHHEGRALASFKDRAGAEEGAAVVGPLADWTRGDMTVANYISLGGLVDDLVRALTGAGGDHPNA
ncbi:hypothetical protein ABZ619_39055 [Streptomyces sp. NPDC007851]|uniref:hypothetical protein n=1 Tax=Streptomyces sp. NPDC007851 TaxID=3155008 RepID=UPI0033C5AA2A